MDASAEMHPGLSYHALVAVIHNPHLAHLLIAITIPRDLTGLGVAQMPVGGHLRANLGVSSNQGCRIHSGSSSLGSCQVDDNCDCVMAEMRYGNFYIDARVWLCICILQALANITPLQPLFNRSNSSEICLHSIQLSD